MRIGILGSGLMGGKLGTIFARAGHEVVFSYARKDSKLIRSIMFDYTRLSQGEVLEDMIISPQYCVDRHGNTTYPGDEGNALRWGDARA